MTALDLYVSPLGRVEGDLDVRVTVEDGVVTSAWTEAAMFRGFEIILRGKDPQAGLIVKAFGIARSGFASEDSKGICIPVKWVWRGEKFLEQLDEEQLHCLDPIYEEFNILVQKEIIDLVPEKLQLPEEW